MAYHYVDCDRDQMFLLPASMRDWLEEGHLAWFVIDVVARINTDTFHARHPNDGAGRPAYNPDMMLALLFYAYGTGVRSSRRIEQLCHTDAAYRVICGHATPDHATIARFTVDHETAIERVFVDDGEPGDGGVVWGGVVWGGVPADHSVGRVGLA